MRTAGLICLALAASACTTVGDATPSTITTTTTLVTTTTTTDADTSVSTESTPPTTTETGVASVQEGDAILGGGTIEAVVESVLPHDFDAQTQGLAWDGAGLIESTGPYGSSQRRFLSPTSARTSQAKNLAPELFATDLVVLDSTGIQLSAREGIATIFSLEDLKPSGQHRFEGDAWGICEVDETLVTSDNSGTLTLRNIDNLASESRNVVLIDLRTVHCQCAMIPWIKFRECSKQRGFAAATRADQSDSIARLNRNGDLIKDRFTCFAILSRYVAQFNQSVSCHRTPPIDTSDATTVAAVSTR